MKHWLSRVLLVLILVTTHTIITAQDNSFAIDDLPPYIHLRSWSENSDTFAFQNPNESSNAWFQVTMNMRSLQKTNAFPLGEPLSDFERLLFQAEDIVSVSPNTDLIIFTLQVSQDSSVTEGYTTIYEYVLANRTTHETWNTSVQTTSAMPRGELLLIAWDNSGNHVAISDISQGGTRKISFIHIPDIKNLAGSIAYEFDEVIIDGGSFYTFDPIINRLHDVSHLGDFVLLTAQQSDPEISAYDEATQFVLWSPSNLALTQLIELPGIEPAASATAFSPRAIEEILVWSYYDLTKARLYLFNYMTNKLTFLKQFDEVYAPMFSPDGRWLSYSNANQLIFLNMEALLAELS